MRCGRFGPIDLREKAQELRGIVGDDQAILKIGGRVKEYAIGVVKVICLTTPDQVICSNEVALVLPLGPPSCSWSFPSALNAAHLKTMPN